MTVYPCAWAEGAKPFIFHFAYLLKNMHRTNYYFKNEETKFYILYILDNQHYTVVAMFTLKHLHICPHYRISDFDNS